LAAFEILPQVVEDLLIDLEQRQSDDAAAVVEVLDPSAVQRSRSYCTCHEPVEIRRFRNRIAAATKMIVQVIEDHEEDSGLLRSGVVGMHCGSGASNRAVKMNADSFTRALP
jgi:hypothetical protein